MDIPEDAKMLRIFIGESDRSDGLPLYEALVRKAKSDGLAGATVVRGMMGFGANSRIHSAGILRLSEDLPIVVEIVDSADKISRFISEIDSMLGEGLATLEDIKVIHYRHRK